MDSDSSSSRQTARLMLKMGCLAFGGPTAPIAMLEDEVVERHGWLGSFLAGGLFVLPAALITTLLAWVYVEFGDVPQLARLLAPGPVLSTATFIGYLLLGVPGAAVSTVAIFLPSCLFVGLLNPIVPRLRRRPWTAAFLDAVVACRLTHSSVFM